MSYLFQSPKSGWRHEPSRKRDSYKKTIAALQVKLLDLENLVGPLNEKTAQSKKALKTLLTGNVRSVTKKSTKRSKTGLRRKNQKSLSQVLERMAELCIRTAVEKKLDVTKEYWFLKAEMAAKLNLPEHFIAQAVHKWNLEGICNQGVNQGMHDTHRDNLWGGPWVSSWQDTRYTLNLEKLMKTY